MNDAIADEVIKESGPRPRAARATEDKQPRKKRTPAARTFTKAKLAEMISGIGVGIWAFNQYDGSIILANSDKLAEELYKLGMANPAVRSALEKLLTGGIWAGVAGVAATITIPILANHGALPRELAAIVGADIPPARPEKPKGEKKTKRRGKPNLSVARADSSGDSPASGIAGSPVPGDPLANIPAAPNVVKLPNNANE